MKFILIALTLAATAIAGGSDDGKVCKSGQSVVCSGNGNAGLLTLGNVAPGALGESCSTGGVYCCDDKDVAVSTCSLTRSIQFANHFNRAATSSTWTSTPSALSTTFFKKLHPRAFRAFDFNPLS